MMGLTSRLLIFNLLLAVFPIGAVLFLGTYESQLLESQERAMVQQGRILASALEDHDIQDVAGDIFSRLGGRTDSRLRVVDAEGNLLADSARPVGDAGTEDGEELSVPQNDTDVADIDEDLQTNSPEESIVYRISALPARLFRNIIEMFRRPVAPSLETEFYSGESVLNGPEIQAALEGRYGATTRISQGQRSITLYSAIPILEDGVSIGAVLVSRSTIGILSDLYRLRSDIATIFLLSIVVAIVLSLVLARTISSPIKRLRDQAEGLLDERGKILDQFKPQSGADEVADLSRALYDLSRRLRKRTEYMEDFIADLVHEMKNPIAGILSAAEIAEGASDTDTHRFINGITREGQRLHRLLDDLKELISVDVQLNRSLEIRANPSAVLKTIVSTYNEHKKCGVGLTFTDEIRGNRLLNADPDRLAQAVLNLLDNAVSFAPSGSVVEVNLSETDGHVCIDFRDRGPGVPASDAEKIFERWYSYREADDTEDHTGLGLAIVKGIAEGYGGRVRAVPREGGGTIFRLELP